MLGLSAEPQSPWSRLEQAPCDAGPVFENKHPAELAANTVGEGWREFGTYVFVFAQREERLELRLKEESSSRTETLTPFQIHGTVSQI